MSKKKESDIIKERETFIYGDENRNISGAVSHGIPEDVAGAIYDDIVPFAGYAFNKAHAVSYAIIAYQTAYLKKHYPREYMAALLTSILDSADAVATYAAECNDLGIGLLPPHVNESGAAFTVSGSNIRYGLVAVKNIGSAFIAGLVRERDENGNFVSVEDFVKRALPFGLNQRSFESLVFCGALDGLGYNRREMISAAEMIMKYFSDARRHNIDGQMDLFDMFSEFEETETSSKAAPPALAIPRVSEYDKQELAEHEHEVTGLYLSGHPVDEYRAYAKKRGCVSIASILEDFAREEGAQQYSDNMRVSIIGAVTSVKTKLTKKDTQMAYVTLDDGTGTMENLVFARVLEASGGYASVGAVVVLTGKISSRDDKPPQLLTDDIEPVNRNDIIVGEVIEKAKTAKTMYLRLPSEQDPSWRHMKLTASMFPGSDTLIVVFADSGLRMKSVCTVHEAFLKEAREVLGAENVAVK